ncbi:MAG TPA: NAD-binding protein, partial [Actinomycetota bacterium]|nr:NAD-binding protein [Actinomycetota bacterium]
MFTRDHAIIAGLGNKGLKLATSFQKAGFRVVVIERDPNNLLIERCHEAEIPVIRGDARDPIVLRRGRLPHARQLIVTCDDATNLNVILAAGAVLGGQTNSAALFVHLDDDNLGRFLKAELLEGSSLLPFRLEYFNVYDTAARTLARQAPFSRSSVGGDIGPHIWIVGLDGVGESLVLHLAGQWLESRRNGDKLPLTVIGPSIEGRIEQLFLRHPELRTVCDLDVKDVPLGRTLLGLIDESLKNDWGRPTLIYVCLEDEAAGLATTLALRSRDRFVDVATTLVLEDDDGGIGDIVRAGQSLQGVETFGFLSDALEPWALLLGANEVIAQARHQVYVDRERAAGVGPAENPSAVPWEELDEDLKEANRDYADGIGAMVAAVNGAVVPAPLVRAEGPLVRFTDEEIERLARME